MNRQKGFTLIELLIVVAIIGIIAAIAIPNLLDAIERSRQKRTVGEIKSLANAMQTFSTDYNGYPLSAALVPCNTFFGTYQDTSTNVIVPDLIQAIPTGDGWGMAYQFQSGPPSAQNNVQLGKQTGGHFFIASSGSDRQASIGATDTNCAILTAFSAFLADPPPAVGTLQSHCYQTDIVWGDSSFLQAPEGKVKRC